MEPETDGMGAIFLAHVGTGICRAVRFLHDGRGGAGRHVNHYDVFALTAALLVVIALMALEGR